MNDPKVGVSTARLDPDASAGYVHMGGGFQPVATRDERAAVLDAAMQLARCRQAQRRVRPRTASFHSYGREIVRAAAELAEASDALLAAHLATVGR